MAVELKAVVAVLWDVLGMGPPPDRVGHSERFEIEDAACRVERSPSGLEVVLTAEVGTLAGDPHGAADRMRRLLRLSLGLSTVNRAALICEARPDEAQLRALQAGSGALGLVAVAVIRSSARGEVVAALEDVLQLRTLALPQVSAGGVARDALFETFPPVQEGRNTAPDDGSMMIFQP